VVGVDLVLWRSACGSDFGNELLRRALPRAVASSPKISKRMESLSVKPKEEQTMLCSRIVVVVACLMPLLSHPLKSEAAINRAPTQQEDSGRQGMPSHDKTVTLLNNGTKDELQYKLGVTADEADNIAKNRPYRDMSQLKKVVSKKTFKQIQKRTQRRRF
jgi:hypothetical protein